MSGDLYSVAWGVREAVPGSEQCFPNIQELWKPHGLGSSVWDDTRVSALTKFPRQGMRRNH